MDENRMLQNLLSLCRIGSISASEAEKQMPALLKQLLLKIPYFQRRPNQIMIHHIREEETKCGYVFALMKASKQTKRTIVLLSHFDVVGIDEYGIGAPYAFDPIAYTDFLKQGNLHLDEESQNDLDSGHYLFGRGICDMKWGIAADIELLHAYSEKRDANLLFVSVPDEERNSEGMLDAIKKMEVLAKQEDLSLDFCMVGEPDISFEQSLESRRLFIGAAGKVMPFFYCVGKETHVGDPYGGLNPNLLSAKVVEYLEHAPAFIDQANGYFTPAPTCLKQSDCKTSYSVQTPYDSYAYFNLMTLSKSIDTIKEQLLACARQAFEEVLRMRDARILQAEQLLNRALPHASISVNVMSYEELYASCVEQHGSAFQKHMETFIEGLEEADMREMTLAVIKETHRYAPDRSAKIILAFAPPYYPHSGFLEADAPLRKICERFVKKAQKQGERYELNACFNGLTDMCYLGLRDAGAALSLAANFPLWGKHYEVPLEVMRKLQIPFVNFGPDGKDPHKYSERIELNYSLKQAPRLRKMLVDEMMRD